MLFKFLRMIFRDDDYLVLEKRLSVAEEQIQAMQNNIENEKKRVDVEFITLLWTMLLASGAFLAVTTQYILDISKKLSSLTNLSTYMMLIKNGTGIVYVVILIFTVYFMWNQASFGLDLISNYAVQKADGNYVSFSKGLRWVFIFFIGINLLYFVYKIYLEPTLK